VSLVYLKQNVRNRLPKHGRSIHSSPVSKELAEKSKDTEDTYCAICQEVILERENGQDAVYCEGQCQSWIHRKCSGLTGQAFEQICESNDKHLCPFCMLSVQNCELMKLRNMIELLSKKVEQLSGSPSSSSNSVDNKIQTPLATKSSTDSHMNDASIDITATVTLLMNEEREKEKHKLNVIIHNLPECDDADPANRKKQDISKTSYIIDKHLGVPATITQAIRIWTKREKPRLLKVTISSSQQRSLKC